MPPVPPFQPAEGPGYLYVQLADYMQEQIKAGDLRPGARLPAERDLAAEHGVALGTARKAVRVLRDRGLVVITPSKGAFVVRPR